MSYGLLDKVRGITTNQILEPSVESLREISKTVATPKALRDITTLAKGDAIRDYQGVVRYVVDVVGDKLILTGLKAKGPNNFKKVFTWTQEKINDAIDNRGFQLI